MCRHMDRRQFLRNSSLAGTAVVTTALSLEEKILMAAPKQTAAKPSDSIEGMPTGKIGDVSIGRLICGGNLIGGYAHSRDLIYVSDLIRGYFTQEKIFETFELCEENGVNTVVLYSGATRHADTFEIINRYKNERGGSIQWLAQINPDEKDLAASVNQAVDNGAVGAFILGNVGDEWVRSGKIDLIGKVISLIKQNGLIAGAAGHNINVPIQCEKAGIDTDFYMKTIHSEKYWSSRRPDQEKDVIDNYSVDNYWDKYPEKTIDVMKTVKKPWIGYKVLAAGAIHPKDGFQYAFQHGADFLCVGMYDFQVRENVIITKNLFEKNNQRERPWMA